MARTGAHGADDDRSVLRQLRARAPTHVLDIDDTPDAVHGGQQLALFNAHYDEYCFQPIHIFDAATAKPVLSLLRPGKRPSGDEAARVLRHVIGRIRRHWPRVEIAVRGDGHYGTPEVMDLLEDQGHGYILGLPGNARLSEIGQPWCGAAARATVQSGSITSLPRMGSRLDAIGWLG